MISNALMQDAVREDHGEVVRILVQKGAQVFQDGQLVDYQNSPLSGYKSRPFLCNCVMNYNQRLDNSWWEPQRPLSLCGVSLQSSLLGHTRVMQKERMHVHLEPDAACAEAFFSQVCACL